MNGIFDAGDARSQTRRSFLRAGAIGAVVATHAAVVPGLAFAQQIQRNKGPRVWRDMDQAELDASYDQSVYALNGAQVGRRTAFYSDAARTRLGAPQHYAYGPTRVEGLDVYTTKRKNAPVHVFLHGGGWRGGSAKGAGFAAETFVNAGAHYVTVDYVDVIQTGGNLLPLADQVRRAVAWVHGHAKEFGGDPERIYVSGHSAGGHLAGVVLTTNWVKDFGLPADLVKGGVCASGMYDLKPVRLSWRSNYVKFTDESEEALSPQRHLDTLGAPLVVVHGSEETPEFQRQAREFVAAVRSAGKTAQLIVAEGYNHFELDETLGNPYGVLGRVALEQMKLA